MALDSVKNNLLKMSLLGLLLGIGAPLGYLIYIHLFVEPYHAHQPLELIHEILRDHGTVLIYITFPTMFVFSAFGYYAGKQQIKLEQARQQMVEILHITAHDIRNPLTIILQGLELLKDPRVGTLSEKQQNLAHSAWKQCKNLHQTLSELLDINKIEAGFMSLEKVPALLSHLIEVTLEEMREQAKQAQIIIQLTQDIEKNFTISLDVFRIRQVLRNILSNALRYAPKQSVIEISVSKRNAEVLVSCTNLGPHIPQEQLKHIFEKFTQIKEKKKLGHGLGLSICKNIIELHGGKIWAENVPQGVCFSFTLPVA